MKQIVRWPTLLLVLGILIVAAIVPTVLSIRHAIGAHASGGASITLSSPSAQPGTTIQVSGRGFTPSQSVTLYLGTASTTTVIMKTLGSEDEGDCGAHDVDNGFDEPRTASCVGMLTRVTAIQANAQVRATQSPISFALPAPSVQQPHRLPCFFFLLAELDAGQPGM